MKATSTNLMNSLMKSILSLYSYDENPDWWNSLLPFTGCTLIPNVDETLKRVYLLSRGKSTG